MGLPIRLHPAAVVNTATIQAQTASLLTSEGECAEVLLLPGSRIQLPGDSPEDLREDFEIEERIASLWAQRKQTHISVKQSREALDQQKLELQKALHGYKQRLVGAGRGGKWARFLRAYGLPLATADRHVKKWEQHLNPPENLLSEELSGPTTEEIAKLVAKVKRTVKPTLTTSDSVAEFLPLLQAALRDRQV